MSDKPKKPKPDVPKVQPTRPAKSKVFKKSEDARQTKHR